MLQVGDIYECPLSFSQEQERLFMKLTGDENPVHWDQSIAEEEGYEKPILHGMLVASIIGKVIGMDFPGVGTVNIERCFKFIRPLYAGEEYALRLKVVEIETSNHCGVIKFSLKNINNKICLTGLTRVRNTKQFLIA